MAQELITKTWCDVCLETEEQTEGFPWRFGVEAPGERWRWLAIDLCTLHQSGLLVELVQQLEKYGRTDSEPKGRKTSKAQQPASKAPRKAGDKLTCPECQQTYASVPKLRAHTVAIHQRTVEELRGEPTPHTCPECGRGFGKLQSLGTHRARAHGYRNPSR